MKTIYIIRHGQTEYNKLKLVQGSGINSNLNEVGWKQAEAFFSKYQHISFDRIYTSKLKRTHQTVRKFIEQSIPWDQHLGLNEISWGEKEGRVISAEDDARYSRMLNAWRNGDYTQKEENGESPQEVQDRQVQAWEKIMDRAHEKNILVCSHGRAIRILLCYLLECPLSEMDRFAHSNTCLYVLKFNGEKYTLELENDVAHLEGLGWNTPLQSETKQHEENKH